jgi:tripartite-type tricarboxylate transporter receptor subunit TctC
VPGYEAINWWGIIAPAGTPRPIVARLHREITALQQSPELQKRFQAEAVEAVQMEPAEFGRFIESETTKWARVVKQANMRAE